ncbi:STAS/SEC14 domain-containing protein [Corallococcus interemptor]|uniref:STAS/SEC14 domain-containing protein n=1 Tax=Corallococcus TaxID=83461 RepID=UPI001CBBA6E0|nr:MULTISPECIES: STAS/SEC14 domain-containing protein [unclassified Corallococcus]MBZ4334717.1 STAS/SEC14 domain-containing protein [Corallococcus sp. AS-1-12]MBZ4375132.1 STAS/SEC14 domain-containing protein [Corallococcus sp. AS-1-6]
MVVMREWVFGTQRVSLESSDILWIKVRGAFSETDVRALVDVFHELGASPEKPLYLVVDLSSSEGLSVAPRKYLAEHVSTTWFRAAVFFGAKRTHREVLRALVVALNFIRDTKLEAEFVDSEAQARAWLESHRRRHEAAPR